MSTFGACDSGWLWNLGREGPSDTPLHVLGTSLRGSLVGAIERASPLSGFYGQQDRQLVRNLYQYNCSWHHKTRGKGWQNPEE